MQRKRRFDESNGGDPDVQVLSVKKPKLNHSGHSGWYQTSFLHKMSQWVQNKFNWRSSSSTQKNTSKINGNGNGVSMPGFGRQETSSHHGFATVTQNYQRGIWPLDDRASGGTMFQSLSRPSIHNGTSERPITTQPTATFGVDSQNVGSLNTSKNRHRFTAGESVRLEDKVRYKQLLQKFTSVDLKPEEDCTRRSEVVKKGPSVPQLPKFFFRSNDSILGSSTKFAQTSKLEKESPKIKIQPKHISSRTHAYNGRQPEEETLLQITDISVIPSTPHTTNSRKSDVIDLTNETQSIVTDSSRCRSFKSSDYRDSKFVSDTWIKDLKAAYNAKARDKERKIAEAEMKTKIYDERRREEDKNLERKIRQQMWIHRKEPGVVEDPPISDYESEEDDLEIVEDQEDVLPELTDEMLNVINNALSRGNPSQVLVDKFRQQITKGDIATLSGLNWLNDEVINFYMNLLMERGENGGAKIYAFNTFFYPKIMSGGQSAVKRWTKRVDVLAVDYILIPVHLGMHWCLAVVNFKKKDIQYYDSMGGSNTQCLSALKKYLCDESLDKKKKEFDLDGWTTSMIKDIPQQMNGSDCGMFACKYAEYITREVPITFTQENMPYFRKRMVYEIVSAKLLQ